MNDSKKNKRNRITYLINNVGFFVSHRLPLALEAIDRGYKVNLITGLPGSESIEEKALETLKKYPIPHKSVPFTSRGMNPFKEIKALSLLINTLRNEEPDIIHAASPKGIFYAAISRTFTNADKLVLSVSGMGFLFTSPKSVLAKLIAKIYKTMMIALINLQRTSIIVQNKDDYAFWSKLIYAKKTSIYLVPGSGVKLKDFSNSNRKDDSRIILLPARLLIDKGVYEFVDAAKTVKKKYPDWIFVLVGAADYDNPSSIDQKTINQWVEDEIIDWWGHQEDMAQVYKKTAIVCLPSYREGMPKVLLEASASGLPVITTDVIGCREAITPGISGLLVASHDSKELAAAIIKLIENSELRKKMGEEGLMLAKEKFSIEKVIASIHQIYEYD